VNDIGKALGIGAELAESVEFHREFDMLIAQPSDTPGPFSFNRGPTFEVEAELAKEINRLSTLVSLPYKFLSPYGANQYEVC
jgi:hypothetical protein